MTIHSFSVFDYFIFALMLAVSAGIGIFYGCFGSKNASAKEMLVANRQMKVFPTAMSLLASFMSGITILGNPSEVYEYGTMFWWTCVASTMAMLVSSSIFVPLFHKLELTSTYEYLERRFNKWVKLMATLIFSTQMIVYMALVLYAPALALSQITGLNTWISVITIGTVCTFYTTIGGMKAVMWTDVFQIIMMFIGLIASFIKGINDFGGVSKVIEVNWKYGRIEFLKFDFDPTTRHTVWGLTFGSFVQWLSLYGVNQSQVQRYLSVPTVKVARRAIFWNLIGLIGIISLTLSLGMVMFAKYHDCDPLTTKRVSMSEQLFPLYVMETLSTTIGLPGLFLACLFSAALSTISSGLNSLAAVFLEDIVKGFFTKNLSDERAAKISKILCLCFAGVMLFLTYVASFLGTLLQAALSLFGVIGGPLLGLFCLGIFVPCANSKGALFGTLSGLILTIWIFSGRILYGIKYLKKPMYTFGCNITEIILSDCNQIQLPVPTQPTSQKSAIETFHSLSYTWYGMCAVITTVTIGTIVSLLTGKNKNRHVDEELIVSINEKIFELLPQCIKRLFSSNNQCEDINKNKMGEIKTPENQSARIAFEMNDFRNLNFSLDDENESVTKI